MKRYILLLVTPADVTTLPERRLTLEERLALSKKCVEHYRGLRQRLSAEGFLNGITTHSVQENIGTSCISGDDVAIGRLTKHVNDQNLGSVMEDHELQVIQ